MSRALLVILMVSFVSLSGCFGGDDEAEPAPDDDGSGDDDGDGGGDGDGNGTVNVTASRLVVTMEDAPSNGTIGDTLDFAWRVDTGFYLASDFDSGNNSTEANATAGSEREPLNETGLVWGFSSVPQPENTTDYPNSEIADEATEAPGNWSVNFTATEPGNATGDPGNGTGGGNETNGTTLYARAYAIDANGTVHWSDEVEVLLEPEVRTPFFVRIAGTIGGPLATYNPSELTIEVGDSVIWQNNDTLGLSHTATSTEGPSEFDTGQIAGGEASDPIVFDTPGTYTYECDNHPTMADATIIVTGGNETA